MQKEYLTQHHPSSFRDQIYVYPVVSRRANGISVGINLSPTALCNFRCIYCQTETSSLRRSDKPGSSKQESNGPASSAPATSAPESSLRNRSLDWPRFEQELRNTVDLIRSGRIFADPHFAQTEPEKRYFRDFAFSGDGEPTLSPDFPAAVRTLARIRRDLDLPEVKLILITNGTLLQKESIQSALDELIENRGEIWVKLDAGTEKGYRAISRSAVPYSTIISNIDYASARWPVVIQTIFLKKNGLLPDPDEISALCDQIGNFIRKGRKITRMQIYTIARTPAENYVESLKNEEMDDFARILRARLPIPLQTFYSH
ncbi:MAG: radical SAM protein [Planctomycetia bacterium]|nr:radical SAM protein [Planctomycetia bacterium]